MKNKLFSIALLISACSLNIFSGQNNQDFKKNMNIALQKSKSEDKNTLSNKIMNHLYKKDKDKNLADFSFLAKILEQQESTQVDFSLAQEEGIQESLDKFFNLQFPNLLENSQFIKGRRSLDKLQKKDASSNLHLIKELDEVTATTIYPEEENITDTQKRHAYQILIDLEALLALHQTKNKNAAIQKLNTFPHDYIWQLITATDRILLPEDFKWLLVEPLTTALATHYKNGMQDADVKEFIETIQNFYRLNTTILLPPYKKYTLQHDDWVNSAQFSPDGTQIVTASNDNTAKVWDVETKKLIHTLPHLDHVNSAQFSPDGTQIVTASNDNTAKIWDAKTEELLHTLPHLNQVSSAQFSPDGKQIVTASDDNTAKIWDVETEKLLRILKHNNDVRSAQFSPDGKKIVTASWWGHTAKVWDVETETLLHTLPHNNEVRSAQFSPDGTQIITASWDETAKVWDVKTGLPIFTLKNNSAIYSAQFSPDSTQIVTASWDGTAQIWDVETEKPIFTLQHTDHVYSAQFSPDGTQTITASWDGTAQIWELNDTLEVTPAERILYETLKKSGLTTFNNVTDKSYATKIIKQLYEALKKSRLKTLNLTNTSYTNTIIKQLNARVEKLNPNIEPLIPVQEQ